MNVELPLEIWMSILSLLGNNDEGFIHRVKARLVCKDFLHVILPCNDGKWNIRESMISYCLDASKYEAILIFDLDDWIWRRVPSMKPKVLKLLNMKECLYWNPHMHKFVWHANQWFMAKEHRDMASFTHMEKVLSRFMEKIPKEPTLHDWLTRSKRRMRVHDERYDTMVRFISSYLSSQQNLTTLKLKDSSLSMEGFKTLASALPSTQVSDLSISCHIAGHEEDVFVPIFMNGQALKRLDIGYCGDLSTAESLALSHLLLAGKLETLKMVFTNIDDDNFTLALRMSCITSLTISDAKVWQHLQGSSSNDASGRSFHCEHHTLYKVHVFDAFINPVEVVQKKHLFDHQRYMLGAISHYVRDYLLQVQDSVVDDSVVEVDVVQDSVVEVDVVQDSVAQHHDVKSKRDRLLRAYAMRNARRNQLISVDCKCKYCGTIWPKGSIKLQTFEGMQSMCKLSTRKCKNHAHYGRVFGE